MKRVRPIRETFKSIGNYLEDRGWHSARLPYWEDPVTGIRYHSIFVAFERALERDLENGWYFNAITLEKRG